MNLEALKNIQNGGNWSMGHLGESFLTVFQDRVIQQYLW